MNTAILIGFLGEDPELRQTSGDAVLKLRLATTQKWKNKAGEEQESTQWHSCILWGRKAEALANTLRKGSCVMVTGSIQYRSWDKDDGTKGYATEIRADEIGEVQLPTKGGGGRQASGGGQRPQQAATRKPAPAGKPAAKRTPARVAAGLDDDEQAADDIPF